ncbi:hypothetical protein BB558_006830, partial [Smittium angustum]
MAEFNRNRPFHVPDLAQNPPPEQNMEMDQPPAQPEIPLLNPEVPLNPEAPPMNFNFMPPANNHEVETMPAPFPHHLFTPESAIKFPEAVRFDGTPASYQAFMNSMCLHFWARPAAFATDRNKIVFMTTHLTGTAAAWFASLLAEESYILSSYQLFVSEFARNFRDPSSAIRA